LDCLNWFDPAIRTCFSEIATVARTPSGSAAPVLLLFVFDLFLLLGLLAIAVVVQSVVRAPTVTGLRILIGAIPVWSACLASALVGWSPWLLGHLITFVGLSSR
jgi:hypothetical protein